MGLSKKALIACFYICIALAAISQDTIVLHGGPRWDSSFDTNLYVAVYTDPTNRKSISEVRKELFVPDARYRENLLSTYGRQFVTAWIRLVIRNPSQVSDEVLLLFHRASFLQLFLEEPSAIRPLGSTYSLFAVSTKNQRRGFQFAIAPATTITVYGRIYNPYRNFATGYPVIIRPAEYRSVMQQMFFDQRYFVFVDILFLSIIIFIAIHTLAQYFFNNKRKEFLLYACYTLCVFVYFLFKFEENSYVDIFFSFFPVIHKYGNNPLSYLMFFAYYRFVRSFINFREVSVWFFNLIRVTENVLLAAIMLDIILVLSNQTPAKVLLFNILRSYLIVMSLGGIYLLVKSRKALSLFIAVGSGCLVLGGLVSMILSWMFEGPFWGRFDPIVYMQFGMVLELVCFTLGLSYKSSLIEKEKFDTQQQLIRQLEENRKLQDELTNKLESRVEEQTSHIVSQQQELEREKEQQLTLGFQKKLTEMELKLLKAQLNPHFYFNTLNNLYGLSMIAPKKAPGAILKLSDIMEYVIYDCKSEKVPLEKEMKFITSYIDLERLRYDEEAAIRLDIRGDCSGYLISPLLLIQFIENAFKHGMEDTKAASFLSISILIADGWLFYYSENSIRNHQRFHSGVGLENVRKRLNLLYNGHHELKIDNKTGSYKVNLKLMLKQ